MHHILVWFTHTGYGYYYHPYAVHLILNDKPSVDTVLDMAKELLIREYPNVKDDFKYKYVGYEYIPIDVNSEFYVVTKIDWYGVVPVSYRPKDVLSKYADDIGKIERWRSQWLTVDIDVVPYSDYHIQAISKTLDIVFKECSEFKFFKTLNGWHVRARLKQAKSLKEIMELRWRCFDDSRRVDLDAFYINSSLSFLTNYLFNEKYMFNDGKYVHYVEEEVDWMDLPTMKEVKLPADIDITPISTSKDGITATFFGSKIVLEGLVRKLMPDKVRKAEEVATKIVSEWRDAKEKVVNIYKTLLAHVEIGIVTVIPGYNTYNVYVKQHILPINRLIGKGGKIVKNVEKQLNAKVRIYDVNELRSEIYTLLYRVLSVL